MESIKTPEEIQQEQTEMDEDAEIVRRAKDHYRIGMEATSSWRAEALKDLEFLAGEQWDPNDQGRRQSEGRPVLTVNRLPQFVRQVTNEMRQSKPGVNVNPVDSGADVRTAEVYQGTIRNVEYTSNADAAYAAGGQSAAITGLGYWDVCAEYEDENSFEQKLSIQRIANSLSCLMDPGAKELAGDDARWCFKSWDMSKGEWAAAFPGREIPTGSGGWESQGDSAANWVAKDGVRIHEYRYIKDEPDTLIETPNGPMLESELHPADVQVLIAAGAAIRPTTKRKACWAKIAGDEVIEKGEFAGHYLQLVRVVGTEIIKDGETIYEGVIRHARDTQRMLNYYVSTEAEAIALTPKAPWIGTPAQFEGFETIWENANRRATAYLPFNPDPQNPGAPQRVMAEANVQAITNARMQAADDLKAVTGIYDAALGARSNEQSGRAILARQSQGQTANFHFQDNLAMAIRYTGRILIDLIPKIYSGPRVLRILGEDGKQEMVPVNGQPGEFRGEPAQIQLGNGRYDVAVSMGPSYQSRRQEATAQMLELLRVTPVVGNVAGDLLIENMDLPNGKAIAERVRKALPPEIRPPDEKQPPAQMLAMQLQQSQQMIEQLTQRLNQLQAEREAKSQELEAQERIKLTELRVELVKHASTLESKENLALSAAYLKQVQMIDARLGLTGFAEPTETTQQPMPGTQQGGLNG